MFIYSIRVPLIKLEDFSLTQSQNCWFSIVERSFKNYGRTVSGEVAAALTASLVGSCDIDNGFNKTVVFVIIYVTKLQLDHLQKHDHVACCSKS